MEPESDLMTMSQVAEALSVSRATVSRWTAAHQIPVVRLPGNILRYRRVDIAHIKEGNP